MQYEIFTIKNEESGLCRQHLQCRFGKKGVAFGIGMNAVGVERFPGCLFAIQQSLIKVDDRTVHVRTIVQEPLAIAAEDLIMTMYGTGFLPAIVGAFRFGQWWNADINGLLLGF